MAARRAWEPETGLTFREQLEEFEAQVKAQAKATVKEKRARGDSVEQIENRLPELNVESVVHAWRLKNDAWIEEVKAQVNAIVNEKHAQGESVEQIENRLHERKLELVGGEQKLSLVRRSNLGDVTNLVTNLGELKTLAAARAEPSATEDLETGVALSKQKKWPEALAAFRAAVEKNPLMSEAWFRIAQVFFKKDGSRGGTGAMYEPLKRCLDLDPCNANAHELRGECLRVDGDRYIVAAAEEYRATIRLDPTNATAPWHLGYMLEHNFGDFQGAAEQYREASCLLELLLLDPNGGSHELNGTAMAPRELQILVLDLLGGVLLHGLHDYRAAEDVTRQLIRIDPGSAGKHCVLSKLLERRGEVDGAICEMETCVRLETHAPYKARLARLIAKRGHVHSAKAICELFVAECDAAGVDPKTLLMDTLRG